MKSGGLGRGLGSLIPKKSEENIVKPIATASPGSGEPFEVSIADIDPNSRQPRLNFNLAELQDLLQSIKKHGVLQPLVVTKKSDGRYELIAGERRLRAAKLAGLSRVPVVVRDVSDEEKLELALIENIQRADLNPIEEASAYTSLIKEFHLTQEEVAARVGKSRPAIANTVRLLDLPEEIKEALRNREIASGQARALLGLETTEEQLRLFRTIKDGGMSTREVEEAVQEKHGGGIRHDPNILSYEADLRSVLGTKVRITEKNGKGKITINYYSREELRALKDKIMQA